MVNDYDSPWKDYLSKYLQQVFDLLFPFTSAKIDWSRGFEFLEQELRQLVPDSERAKRIADALVKVYLHNGNEQWVLIHIEVQGQRDVTFPERMFISYYRIFDKHKQRVAGFAIFSDDDLNWHPTTFFSELLDAYVEYRFNTAKLIQLTPESLEESTNPFAWIVLAHRAAQQTSKNVQARLRTKIRLTQQLADKRYSLDAIYDLYRFMDWVMQLPAAEALQYKAELRKLESEPMKYISSIEQMALAEGIEKGLEKGLEQGRIGIIMLLLERLVVPVNETAREAIERLDARLQSQLAQDLLSFKHPDDLHAWLAQHQL